MAVPSDEKKHFLDHPRNVSRLLKAFFALNVLLLGLDLLIHRHAQFPWEGWFGFYAVFGFVCCVVLVLLAKYVLRPLVIRREDYYDR